MMMRFDTTYGNNLLKRVRELTSKLGRCPTAKEIYDADHMTLSVICCDCDEEFSMEHSEVRNGQRMAKQFLLEMQDAILADC